MRGEEHRRGAPQFPASRINMMLSIPMLFFMVAIRRHFPRARSFPDPRWFDESEAGRARLFSSFESDEAAGGLLPRPARRRQPQARGDAGDSGNEPVVIGSASRAAPNTAAVTGPNDRKTVTFVGVACAERIQPQEVADSAADADERDRRPGPRVEAAAPAVKNPLRRPAVRGTQPMRASRTR